MRLKILLPLLTLAAMPILLWAVPPSFNWHDDALGNMYLRYDDRTVLQYRHGYDPARREETYKPYCHVYDPATGTRLTKGPGGLFTHHRAIFLGWNKLHFKGQPYDFWHMNQTLQLHRRFTRQEANADRAVIESLIHWQLDDGTLVLKELRRMTVHLPTEHNTIGIVDIRSELTPTADVRLDGDPEHAGLQYRATNVLAENPADRKATYLFHRSNIDPKKDKDLPWALMSYPLKDKTYHVIHMNHPDNPSGTIYSAYLDYGRFGAFPAFPIRNGDFAVLQYRIVLHTGERPTGSHVNQWFQEYIKMNKPMTPASSPSRSSTQTLNYPATQKLDHIDTYHGVKVTDPYRWLEEDVRESDRVKEWVDAQNQVTFSYLESLPRRQAIEQRLTELWDYAKFGTPFRYAGRYYFFRNNGLQNHHVLFVADSLDGPRRELLNPNTWSEDGTVALGGIAPSEDGRYIAYGIQDSGSDWRTWKVRDIETGQDLSDTLKYLKFTGLAWDPQSAGFFYAKYPDPSEDEQFQSANLNMKVMYHRLGTPQSQDVVVYHRPDQPKWGYGTGVTNDGRYLIITVWVGTDDKYRVLYKDLHHPYAAPVDLICEFKNLYSFIENDGPVFYFHTDLDAPNGRVIAIDIRKPQPEHWQEIIPETPQPLESVSVINNLFVISYLKDVTTAVKLFTLDGRHLRDVTLPGPGTAAGFSGRRADTETFYNFESITTPDSIYRYDLITHESTLIERAAVKLDTDDYITEQHFYHSKDGTRIPIFIAYKQCMQRNGGNPTLLYAYGGFNITIAPRFSVSLMAWMEMGGIYAVANLRGGGEYGKTWHEAGKRFLKQNVFDDFIAAGEYLISENYTSSDKLAIMGGSNGGLLVGACMTQRPDLYAAAVPAVGVMDMLRFDQFTAGRFWVDEYGSVSESPEMFAYIKGYSPYHNLTPGTHYPATLITTADTDDRVVPSHSFKFAARLQETHHGSDPVLIRIETRAGHGSGKPTSMIIEEQADIYAFLMAQLGDR